MSTLDRYVTVAFLRNLVLLLAVGIGLWLLGDLLFNLDEFTENRALTGSQVLAAMVDYYKYNIFLYFSQLGGPALALAGAFTVALMLRHNEMTALVAAGMPLQRIAVPILVCALGFVGVWTINREFVLPAYAHKIARHHDDLTGQRIAGISFARDDNDAILTARRINLPQQKLERVVIVEPAKAGGHIIQADEAIYDPARRTWRLEAGRRIVEGRPEDTSNLNFGIERTEVTEYPYALSPEQLLLRQSSEWAGLLSLRQMNTLLKSRNLPNLTAVRMQRHIWLTQPILQWLLLVLPLPFFLRREPGSVLAAGARALLLAGAFFAVTFFAHNMVTPNWAALVTWIPILAFGPVAVLQMANVRT